MEDNETQKEGINNQDNPQAQSPRESSLRQRRSITTPESIEPTNQKRSIRDIKRSSDNKRNNGSPAFADNDKYSSRRYKSAGKGKIVTFIGAVVAVFLLFIVVGNLTHRAELALETKSYNLSADSELALSASEGYANQVLTVSESTLVPADEVEEVNESAEGVLTVINETDSPQTLIATTRFESPNGRVYKTPTAITVPAASGSQPGELANVRVVAAEAGQEYNGNVSGEFSVPGLVGSELEGEITAVAKSEFSGGFSGSRPVPSDSDLNQAIDDLTDSLSDNFVDLARAQLGQDVILLGLDEGGIEFDSRVLEGEGEASAKVEVTASTSAQIVSKEQFLRALLEQNRNQALDLEGLEILNPESIEIMVRESSDEEVSFSLDSAVRVGYLLDESSIAEALAGMSDSEVDEALSDNPAVVNYELSISPFWRNSIPNDVDRITVNVNQGRDLMDRSPVDIDESNSSDDVSDIESDDSDASVLRTRIGEDDDLDASNSADNDSESE